MNSVPTNTAKSSAGEQAFPQASAQAPGDLENRVLRQAVQENLVSFPSQVPVFEKQSRPDLQQKIVILYFVRGWTMDDIATRYGLGRQRMGQILTAWRTRAVKEGYIQAVEPEHPLFQRVRLDHASQPAEVPVRTTSVQTQTKTVAPEVQPALTALLMSSATENVEPPPATVLAAEPIGSDLAEELHAIVGVLDNHLRLCAKPLSGRIDSCELLLTRARVLCDRLESAVSSQVEAGLGEARHGEWRTQAVLAAAKELFQRFQEYALEHSAPPSQPTCGQDVKRGPVKPFAGVTQGKNMPPRTSQRVALEL